MAIRRFGMLLDYVIFRPVARGDCSGRDDEREQNKQRSAGKTHDKRVPDLALF